MPEEPDILFWLMPKDGNSLKSKVYGVQNVGDLFKLSAILLSDPVEAAAILKIGCFSCSQNVPPSLPQGEPVAC